MKSPHNWGYILLSHLWTLTRIDQSVVRRHLSVLSLSIPLASGSESPILKASSSILANKCWIGLSLYSNFATPCRTALRIDSEEMISRHQPIFFFSKRNLERVGGDLFLLVARECWRWFGNWGRSSITTGILYAFNNGLKPCSFYVRTLLVWEFHDCQCQFYINFGFLYSTSELQVYALSAPHYLQYY